MNTLFSAFHKSAPVEKCQDQKVSGIPAKASADLPRWATVMIDAYTPHKAS